MNFPADERLQWMLAELAASANHPRGPAGRLRDLEAMRGFTPILPGANKPFSLLASDWHDDCVVSLDGADVRIVLITAKHPGHGAFRRLITNIERADLVPVVVAPVGWAMPAILKRWGWVCKSVGTGFGHEDHWRAP